MNQLRHPIPHTSRHLHRIQTPLSFLINTSDVTNLPTFQASLRVWAVIHRKSAHQKSQIAGLFKPYPRLPLKGLYILLTAMILSYNSSSAKSPSEASLQSSTLPQAPHEPGRFSVPQCPSQTHFQTFMREGDIVTKSQAGHKHQTPWSLLGSIPESWNLEAEDAGSLWRSPTALLSCVSVLQSVSSLLQIFLPFPFRDILTK